MSKENSPSSSSTEPTAELSSSLGDPNCPICGGIGYIREDLPIDHPNFGRMQVCSCRQATVNQQAYRHLLRLSNLDAFQEMTFEKFNVSGHKGLREDQTNTLVLARDQSTHFAQNLQGWLLLMGNYGCGKTHLAAAIANHAVSLGIPTLFLTVPDLLDWLRFSFDQAEGSFEGRFEEIRNIQLLVLDDLGTQNATPWAQEKLFQIVNDRYVKRLPTVVTTNQNLEEIDGRIRSRLQDPELVTKVKITAPDYRSPTRDDSQSQLSSLHLHAERTFGNFSLREHEKLPPEEQKSLEKAFYAAQEFAERPAGWLVLMGTYGTGKTHLAAAIGNYRAALDEEPILVSVPDLLDHLRATFSPTSNVSYDSLFKSVRNSSLLILDDLGTQSATPWAREKLYQILDHRYVAKLPTVITSSIPLEDIDPRIRSRMLDKRLCNIFALNTPAYRSGVPSGKTRRPAQSASKK